MLLEGTYGGPSRPAIHEANMKIVAVIQARTGSTRLPGKVLLPLAGRPLLERMLDRVMAATQLDEVVVATTRLPSDEPIRALCAEIGARCTSGDPDDLLDRHLQAARETGADAVVKIPSDCPLIDPAAIDETVTVFRKPPPPFRLRQQPAPRDVAGRQRRRGDAPRGPGGGRTARRAGRSSASTRRRSSGISPNASGRERPLGGRARSVGEPPADARLPRGLPAHRGGVRGAVPARIAALHGRRDPRLPDRPPRGPRAQRPAPRQLNWYRHEAELKTLAHRAPGAVSLEDTGT